MENNCSVCNCPVDTESAAILTMGGFATPRYICSECDSDIDVAMTSRDTETARSAMDRIGKKMVENKVDDGAVLKTVEHIMRDAAKRAELIDSGEYDFSKEEVSPETDFECEGVPEELLETEEDRELDRREAEANKKADKIINWVCLIIILAALAFLAYRVITDCFL